MAARLYFNILAKTLMCVNNSKLFVDLPEYRSPSIITGDKYRPDMLLVTSDNTLYVAELTVGHEANLQNNSIRKTQKYSELVRELKDHYKSVIFVKYISMSCLDVFANESISLLTMLAKIGFDGKQQDFSLKRMTTIPIRTTYFIFCSIETKSRTIQGPVVRRMNSAIQRIAIFSNFLKLFIYWYKPDYTSVF